MSIEDINHLKLNSIKQSYTFLIDSNERDRNVYPNPNNYTIEFSTPFKNVIGMEIIDASIPRTMYNIDVENNTMYYYIGKDDNDELIKNGITENINADLEVTNSDIVNDSLRLRTWNYAFVKNQVNLYNIYSENDGIGGKNTGITFTFTIKTAVNFIEGTGVDNSYTIIDFRYDHLINATTVDDSPIVVKVIRLKTEDVQQQIFNLSFKIGTETNEFILYNINLNNFTHITWCISENNIWTIYLNSVTDSSKTYTSSKGLINVYYTEKYIGKRYGYENGDWNIGSLYIKNFKIYNKVLNQEEVIKCMNNINDEKSYLPVIWYKMTDASNLTKNYGNTYNKNYPGLFNYIDIFNKTIIEPGNYTLKTFVTSYDEGENFEIGFANNSDPSELTNLINIYSKKPFILDMKRSTISETIGFDLRANAIDSSNKYNYKSTYSSNSNMIKIFHSILNNNPEKNFSNSFADIYKVVSPGIVYFIGNKYIVMKCPEIEEHLYRSLSYSKFSLGLAKFRVDNVGINNERLTITKIPVREFHPIGKFAKMTLRFETNAGTLYDFKGVNHNIVFAIYYYEPTQKSMPYKSLLNPEYKMNYIDYKYSQEQIESDSDDDEEDFSRDNINDYKKKENMYSEQGLQLQKFKKMQEYGDIKLESDSSEYSDN